jgi:hypothetical protein
MEAAIKGSRPFTDPTKNKATLGELGFVDMQEVLYKWPLNTWSKEEVEGARGLDVREHHVRDGGLFSRPTFQRAWLDETGSGCIPRRCAEMPQGPKHPRLHVTVNTKV